MAHETHVVSQGEDILSIAELYRSSAETIWNDALNQDVRKLRKSPFVLHPGDVLMIPPMQPKRVSIETDKRHTFHRKGLAEKFILHLQHNDQPRSGVRYALEVEKRPLSGVTDAAGKIEHWIRPTDRRGILRILDAPPPGVAAPEVYEILLGHLDPVATDSGIRARLANLGFLSDPDSDDEKLKSALEDFQWHWKLRVTGRPDEKTRAKLLEIHQS